ncbi:hypothetical protein PR048_001479 [Dryococelus australis]|uniref:Uncharacterized protein n=1 Tax=Dryococelus australis TaxID=614101 RepID=A0ABQ9IIH7_9NEOP|nr:hypothetical protein PR048_001479 [Dryococelus australis]
MANQGCVNSSDRFCYICGYSSKNKKAIAYPNLPSAIHPVPHYREVPVPCPAERIVDVSKDACDSDTIYEEFQCDVGVGPQQFRSTQYELNDLIRVLGLPEDKSEILGSRLKEKNLLATGTSLRWYRSRKMEFIPYFSQEGALVYCSDIHDLIEKFNTEYKEGEWRLFH